MEPAPERGDFFGDTKPKPAPELDQWNQAVARIDLASQLDRHQTMLHLQLGPSVWQVGVAGDAAFKRYYFTFRQGSRVHLAPLDIGRLRSGVDIEIEPGLVYNFKISPNIFDPVRRSTLKLRPARGTSGRSHDIKTGDILDAARALSFVFSAEDAEYWVFYGTDVDPSTGQFGSSRSLLFVRYDGLNSRAWPLAEDALPLAQAMRVQLSSPLILTRTPSELAIAPTR